MELEGEPTGSNSYHHATGEEVTADVNGTATDDENILNTTGSLHSDIVGHESTNIIQQENRHMECKN